MSEENKLTALAEYISTKEFRDYFNNSSPKEQETMLKKIEILKKCMQEYQDALRQAIAEDNKKEWSKP